MKRVSTSIEHDNSKKRLNGKYQRQHNEIINDIEKSSKLIDIYTKTINDNKDRIERYLVELNNIYIKQHKMDTCTQFILWKNEFLNNSLNQNDYIPLNELLNEFIIVNWDIECYLDLDNLTEYKNSIQIKIGKSLTVYMSVIYSVKKCITEIILKFNRLEINILENDKYINTTDRLSNELNIKSNTLQKLIGLCWHTFMFHPYSPYNHFPINSNGWMKNATFDFYQRTEKLFINNKHQLTEKRIKELQCKYLNCKFLSLYYQNNEIDILN